MLHITRLKFLTPVLQYTHHHSPELCTFTTTEQVLLSKPTPLSHLKERSQHNCLNCNAIVQGRFCHICGQENIEPRESVWHLVSHFLQDITHFDGKFFSTLKYLLFRPGYLSREYLMGRRNSYLNPIRMYVFTSAFFFLFFFNFGNNGAHEVETTSHAKQVVRLRNAIRDLKEQRIPPEDTFMRAAIGTALVTFESQLITEDSLARLKATEDSLRRTGVIRKIDSVRTSRQDSKERRGLNVNLTDGSYSSLLAYDTIQSLLPADRRETGWKRLLIRKGIDVKERSAGDGGTLGVTLLERFVHTMPQMFFLSLPIFAFLLWILYKRQHGYFYVNHAIFSIHIYCATFILTFIFMLLNACVPERYETVSDILTITLCAILAFYEYKSMRNFYQQRRGKTILKFIILNILAFFVISILIFGFFIFSLWKV